MSFIKKVVFFTMVFVGLQLNYLQAADNSMWSKDISDPYWKVQKAVIDRARGSQLQSILDLKRPEGYSDEAWDALRNSVNNSLLNDEVVYAPRQRVQVEAAERSGQSDRVEPEDISVAEFANNAVQMYPQLVEGFEVLRQTGQEVPTYHDFVQRRLRISPILQEFMEKRLASGNFVDEEQFDSNQDLAFHNTIAAAENIISGGMKDHFLDILRAAAKQKDENVLHNQDPIFQYVLKYSVGIKRPDGSFTNNNQFMTPKVREWKDYGGHTLLHFAAVLNLEDVAKSMIDAGADVNARNRAQMTPLHIAALYNADKIVPLLLAAGINVDARDNLQRTPLHYAAWKNADKVVPLLLAAGADVDARDQIQETPLHGAAVSNADKVVPLLLDAGADVNAKSSLQSTPLHDTAWNNADKVVPLLLDAGANIDARDQFQRTPLHCAAWKNADKVVPLLLAAGADITIVDWKGKTAEQRATTPEMRAIFEQAKIDREQMRVFKNQLKKDFR